MSHDDNDFVDEKSASTEVTEDAEQLHANKPRVGWEVVEEIEAETVTPTPQQPEPASYATPTDTYESNQPQTELENPLPIEDNDPGFSTENPMSQTHDYAHQQLEHFEEPTQSHSPGEYFQHPHPARKIPYLLIGGILLGVIGIGLIAKLVFSGNSDEQSPSAADILIESTSGSPTPTPSTQPTESTAPSTIQKDELAIQVLNGSGVVGAAGKLAGVLTKAGYTEDIDTGNASNYNAEGVRIQVKEGKTSIGEEMEKDLQDDYENITVRDNLDEDSEYDVVVTLGKQASDADTSGDVEGASDSADLKQASDKSD